MTKLYRAHNFRAEVAQHGVFENPYLLKPRLPVTTPLPVHTACDDWFDTHFKTRFRSRAIFGTGSLKQAREYLGNGAVLLSIWPLGSYKICYSPYVYDLFDHFSTNFSGQSPSPEAIAEELKNMGYCFSENMGLEAAASSNCEVMLMANAFGYEVQ